jgi:hypothetical protein
MPGGYIRKIASISSALIADEKIANAPNERPIL